MDGVKGCLSDRGTTIPEAKECVKDRREWRRIFWGGEGHVDDQGESEGPKKVIFGPLRQTYNFYPMLMKLI